MFTFPLDLRTGDRFDHHNGGRYTVNGTPWLINRDIAVVPVTDMRSAVIYLDRHRKVATAEGVTV